MQCQELDEMLSKVTLTSKFSLGWLQSKALTLGRGLGNKLVCFFTLVFMRKWECGSFSWGRCCYILPHLQLFFANKCVSNMSKELSIGHNMY